MSAVARMAGRSALGRGMDGVVSVHFSVAFVCSLGRREAGGFGVEWIGLDGK